MKRRRPVQRAIVWRPAGRAELGAYLTMLATHLDEATMHILLEKNAVVLEMEMTAVWRII